MAATAPDTLWSKFFGTDVEWKGMFNKGSAIITIVDGGGQRLGIRRIEISHS